MAFYSNGKGGKIANNEGYCWYHGSQIEMLTLLKGSSITKNKALAIAFSHRPSQVSIDYNGNIQHDGQTDGYLYIIDEDLHEEELRVHEACNSDDPWELITTRELKLKLIEKTTI